ncbi:multidrug effflux MFS transporter [Amorphus sp. 3PC139-8]|uniref:multidrug effflux MFS transporter n=1 Tax=Amorphus sp. 3PC139-8 TaxID=2735676 RepID=UPI00345CAD83
MTPTETPASARPTISHVRLVWMLGLLAAFAPFATDMYLASFPALVETYAASEAQVQLGLSMFFLGLSVGQLIYGPVIDRFGRKTPLLVGIVVFIAASLAITVAPSIEAFVLLRFLQATGGCAGMIIGRAIIRDLFDEREGARVLSIMMMIMGVAPVIAPSLGATILGFANWQAIFFALTLFGLLCLALASMWLPETLPQAQRQSIHPREIARVFATLLSRRAFIVPTLAGSVGFAGMFAFISGSPFVFMEYYGVDQQAYGLLFAINAAGMVGASQLNRFLLTRLSTRAVFALALAINVAGGAAVLALAVSEAPLPALFAALWITLATVPLIAANTIAIGMSASGTYAGSASSIIGVLQFACASLASAAVGLLSDGTAAAMATVIFACGVAAALILLLTARRA